MSIPALLYGGTPWHPAGLGGLVLGRGGIVLGSGGLVLGRGGLVLGRGGLVLGRGGLVGSTPPSNARSTAVRSG